MFAMQNMRKQQNLQQSLKDFAVLVNYIIICVVKNLVTIETTIFYLSYLPRDDVIISPERQTLLSLVFIQ